MTTTVGHAAAAARPRCLRPCQPSRLPAVASHHLPFRASSVTRDGFIVTPSVPLAPTDELLNPAKLELGLGSPLSALPLGHPRTAFGAVCRG